MFPSTYLCSSSEQNNNNVSKMSMTRKTKKVVSARRRYIIVLSPFLLSLYLQGDNKTNIIISRMVVYTWTFSTSNMDI